MNKLKSLLKKSFIYNIYKKFFPSGIHEYIDYLKYYFKALKTIKKYNLTNDNVYDIIVSLTTYPKRIKIAGIVIASLMNQTIKPKKIVLTLADSQFPKKKLPLIINKAVKSGLEIIWSDDLRSHKKYYFVMQKYPEDIIITVDDDNYYYENTLEVLYNSYKKYPNAVSCIFAHKIEINDNKFQPYNTWKNDLPSDIPSTNILAVGVGGVLYPPHSLNAELFNDEFIKENCISIDDIWLKTMEILNNPPTPVVKTDIMHFITIPTSQETNLFTSNVYENVNDIQFKNILNKFSEEELIKRIKD